ncbi:MAG TPA: hypothetical protein PJ994_03985 [Tepidiformaceae bacterium]|nr:hypothetical protein [Tepidiformaceae bacterium]
MSTTVDTGGVTNNPPRHSPSIPVVIRMLSSTGLDIGCDRLSTVVSDYEGPFALRARFGARSF